MGAEPELHQFTVASEDVQGLSVLRSMANVAVFIDPKYLNTAL